MRKYIAALGLGLGPCGLLVGWITLQTRTETGGGSVWITAHLLLTAAYILLLAAVFGLARLMPRRSSATDVAVGVSALGLLALIGQMVIDFAVGVLATSAVPMGDLFDTLQDSLAMNLVFYAAGPALFYTGLLALIILLRRAKAIAAWATWVAAAGIILIGLAFMVIRDVSSPVYAVGLVVLAVGLIPLGKKVLITPDSSQK